VRALTGMLVAALAFLCVGAADAQVQIPKELDGWRDWVLSGQEYRRCPFLANSDGTREENRICAWPGRLGLEVNEAGAHFTQSWVSYAPVWAPLPGNLENWPGSVTVNGRPAAVVARNETPYIRLAQGTSTIAGSFTWSKRPETLSVPDQTGLVSLAVDSHRVDQVDRADGAIWLGKQHQTGAAQQLSIQVYRLLSDGVPATLETRLLLQAAGNVREELLPSVLPSGFEPMSLESELPTRIDPDGRMRIQVRPGSWTVRLSARDTTQFSSVTIPAGQPPWPKQEIWSYATNERLRVAALEGGEAIDPTQADVPHDWRENPSFKITAGATIKIVERARGVSSLESNHLRLRRELYLDFSHEGYTAVDQIAGQMRHGWRLDMRSPYRLLRATSGDDNLLVTEAGAGALTGVEVRTPALSLETVARIGAARGGLAATGWDERFDHVDGVLNLPPGHRLLAALGADNAPGAWVEQWGLLDLFLLLLAAVVAFRVFGWAWAAVAFLAIVLVHQEEHALVWLILCVLLSSALLRIASEGWPLRALKALRYGLLGLLLVALVPFSISQVRYALYPQLAVPGGFEVNPLGAEEPTQPAHAMNAGAPAAPAAISRLRPPMTADAPVPAYVPPSAFVQEAMVSAAGKQSASSSSVAGERYAPDTLLQAGPGVPRWRYVTYPFGWSGPVESAQTVRFMVLRPGLVSVWRVLGVALLALLFTRLARGSLDVKQVWRGWLSGGAVPALALALACMLACAPSRASSTPDPELLNELKTRLSAPAKCVPDCADYMAAQIIVAPANIEVTLQVAALSFVAVPLPVVDRLEPDAISIDGTAVAGVYRDADQRMWIEVEPGAHVVKFTGRLPSSDAVEVLFPWAPHEITVAANGWDITGINAGRLLGNTLELVRSRAASGGTAASQGPSQFAPYVRVRRHFDLNLDWLIETRVERMAPEKGGFTLQLPLLAGERVLTNGVTTIEGTQILAAFDSDSDEFSWNSALPHTDSLLLTAPRQKPWSEVWTFTVNPTWHVEFAGIPAVMPENMQSGNWTFEYFPRPGETLTLKITRPLAAAGNTLAIDSVVLDYRVGRRITAATLRFEYRSTRGGRHGVVLPEGARVTSFSVDGKSIPIRVEKSELALSLSPGSHSVQIDWESFAGASVRTHFPPVDLQSPSSNVESVVRMPAARWVLYAGGGGIGPVILYWGELVIFLAAAYSLGRVRQAPLRTYEWLLLGLGLSTFSWSVLLLFAVWIFAMRWRETFPVQELNPGRFLLLQIGLVVLSVAAVVSLVAAIPYGLLANPDMGISGAGQSVDELHWFNDTAGAVLPAPWVLSLSLWWYKAAMLVWALWLAFASARWLPAAWRALGVGGYWRNTGSTSTSEAGATAEV
jgi:hypothetical protein